MRKKEKEKEKERKDQAIGSPGSVGAAAFCNMSLSNMASAAAARIITERSGLAASSARSDRSVRIVASVAAKSENVLFMVPEGWRVASRSPVSLDQSIGHLPVNAASIGSILFPHTIGDRCIVISADSW